MTETLRLVVTGRRTVAEGVVELLLRSADGDELPTWEPGAHIDLVLDQGRNQNGNGNGNGNRSLVRQYSLCGNPTDRGVWRIAVLREPAGRGGSMLVYEQLTEGTAVLARGPRNHFRFEPAPRCLFIAGGIGITPLLPMIAAADRTGLQWRLLYGGRTRTSMAFADELERYGDAVAVQPQDEYGLLDLDAFIGSLTSETLVYCCGPEPLLSAAIERCAPLGPDILRLERFSPLTSPTSLISPASLPRPADAADDAPFEVELARSGRVLTVDPGHSILATLLDAGLNPMYSCTEGTCGSCEIDVLEGEVEHRDSVLTASERAADDCMMICVSRARSSRLVLDI